MKFFIKYFLFFSILNIYADSNLVYLIRDEDNDYGDRLFEHVNLESTYVIWNYNWQPNMWFLTRQLLQEKSDLVLKTPSFSPAQNRAALMNELKEAKWVIDNTLGTRFSMGLDPVKEKWLLDKTAIIIYEPTSVDPITWDPAFHNRVAHVFTWDDGYVAKNPKKYSLMRFPFYSGAKMIEPVPFANKKLCCFMNANKGWGYPNSLYEKRKEDMEYWDRHYPQDFDLYGGYWPVGKYKTHRGEVPSERKIDCLKNYRFTLAYENAGNVHGWVAEKIFHCFEAGCVPVYLGPINIDQLIPRGCYIDRNQFADNAALYKFLKNMSEEEYNGYLERIRAYLDSDLSREFSRERFAEYIVAGLLSF